MENGNKDEFLNNCQRSRQSRLLFRIRSSDALSRLAMSS